MRKENYTWAIIGAGPAGIATVGQLLERGINPHDIIWIDPEFKVGDFGKFWYQVSSNTRVKLFNDFLNHLAIFDYKNRPQPFLYDSLPEDKTCRLGLVVEPLQWVSQRLQSMVNSIHSKVDKMQLADSAWNLYLADGQKIKAKNVVLATGAIAKSVDTPQGIEGINIYDALNPQILARKCTKKDTVAVFGSSHSAIILIRELLELGVKQVINFYRQPLRFALLLDNWILFDDTGLKGNTAQWAREHINGKIPHNLLRVYASTENVKEHLPLCSKAIYAIGFRARAPIIEGYPEWKHNPYNGIVAAGLFAIGIGFPETRTDPYGNTESRVGLWKFMDYLDRIVPLWLKYNI